MSNNLSKYLDGALKENDWSQRELARRAGVSSSQVSEVISNHKQPGWDFCAAIAGALNKSPVELFQLAGLLPGLSATSSDVATYYANTLTEDERYLIELFRKVPMNGHEWVLRAIAGCASATEPEHGKGL